VLRDRAQGHELPRRPRRHLRTIVTDGQQDRTTLVIAGQVQPLLTALERGVEQPSICNASMNTTSIWVEVSSADTIVEATWG
jgi:hypothetical protein